MKLLLKRIALKPTYTIGWLYIDGQKVCDTIEDAVRDLNKNGRFDNGEKKVYAATAIPYGTYDITLKSNPRSIRIGRSTNSATATCLGCSMCRSSTAS